MALEIQIPSSLSSLIVTQRLSVCRIVINSLTIYILFVPLCTVSMLPQVYIYSSGSRLVQRLVFGKTNYGDLRKYLSGFFDTKVGNKKETHSYIEISESLGVNKPSDILFLTDVFQEAVAAKAAGLEVMISIRPGNAPLPDDQSFKTITLFAEI